MSHTRRPAAVALLAETPETSLSTTEAQADLIQEIMREFLSGKSALTLKAYARDVEDFARFIGVDTPEQVIVDLLSNGRRHANTQARDYREYLQTIGLQPATINRRLAALASLVDAGETQGAINWTLKVSRLKAKAYKDTRGPGLPALRKLLDSIDGTRPRHIRDRAMIRLLFDLALRRKELCGLLLADLEMEATPPKLWILGKGRTEKEALTIPPTSLGPLTAWLHIRGDELGPLFPSFSRRNSIVLSPIHPDSFNKLLAKLAAKVGLTIRPHGIRHTSITAALTASNGNHAKTARFSRHAQVQTVAIYDDNRRDEAGELAALVGESL